jgi:hypothetical protein
LLPGRFQARTLAGAEGFLQPRKGIFIELEDIITFGERAETC